MSVLLSLCGLALLAFYLKHSDRLPPDELSAVGAADKLFPYFLGHQLPTGCAGLIIAAFLCDAMQTLESGVNSITAVVTNDVLPRLRQGHQRILSDLSVARVMTIVITALVTANACFVAVRTETAKAEAQQIAAAMTVAEKSRRREEPSIETSDARGSDAQVLQYVCWPFGGFVFYRHVSIPLYHAFRDPGRHHRAGRFNLLELVSRDLWG